MVQSRRCNPATIGNARAPGSGPHHSSYRAESGLGLTQPRFIMACNGAKNGIKRATTQDGRCQDFGGVRTEIAGVTAGTIPATFHPALFLKPSAAEVTTLVISWWISIWWKPVLSSAVGADFRHRLRSLSLPLKGSPQAAMRGNRRLECRSVTRVWRVRNGRRT